MVVNQVTNDAHLRAIIAAADYRLVVLDFYADWCPPCRAMSPVFEQLSNYYSTVVFVKINVDQCRTVSQQYNVTAMPTFVLLVRGQEVDRLQGGNPDRLRQLVELHIQTPPKASANKANAQERDWLHKNIVSRVDYVKQYEDEVNKMVAISVIPLEEINKKATVNGKLSAFEQAKHLMDWFHGFFKWVDKAKCQNCGNADTKFLEQTDPTEEERTHGGANRVEVFECQKCGSKPCFVRYNNPAVLMETREGRCGEWANAFTLCCRAIGLEARYVLCTEDHVWTEIYDPDRKSWIHCDACENIIDRPLLYEKGWKKDISYAFGIALDHVQDVTWRYTFDHKKCRKRRKLCRENVLLNCITKLNARLQRTSSEERKTELKKRQLVEIIAFLSPKLNLRGADDEMGRTSGELCWRAARGEIHPTDVTMHEPFTIKPSEAELAAKSLVLEYDCVNDVYRRPNDNNSTSNGFTSLMHQAENVARKVERDWKMAYVCRVEGTKSTDFSWKFSFEGHKVKRVQISLGEFSLYGSGKAHATVCGGDLCSMLEKDGSLELTELEGAEYIEVSVHLGGGDGEIAWQQAQLFRTPLGEARPNNMRVEIEFE